MDVNKIIEMLEKEDVPFIPKRNQVAKESIVRACNGSYDDINRLLEEDIAIDEQAYRQKSRSSRESFNSIRRKDQEWVDYDLKHRKDGISKATKKDIKKDGMRLDKWNEVTAKEAEGAVAVTVQNPIPSPVMRQRKADESTTEKSPMKGTTDDIVKSKPIDFKSKNNGFETSVSKETGKACAMNEKQTQRAAGEEVIETKKDSVFPEELDFDEEAFAELFGLDPKEVSGEYVEEEDNIPEHIEIRFTEGENEVLLKIMDDGTLIEEVNAEIIDEPRFAASIEQDEEGKFVLLISSAEEEIPMSENDSESMDEDGLDRTDEFVEEAGLNLDSEYSVGHKMKPAKNAADKIKDPTTLPVHESVKRRQRTSVSKKK